MIRVLNDYVIIPGPYDYTLAKDTGRKDKDGNDKYKAISYHGSVKQAIVALRDHCRRLSLMDGELSLCEALTALRTIDKQFYDLLNECMEEKK